MTGPPQAWLRADSTNAGELWHAVAESFKLSLRPVPTRKRLQK